MSETKQAETRAGFENFNESEDGSGFDLQCYSDNEPDLAGEYVDGRAQAALEAWKFCRQQTAKEIADWLDAEAPTQDDGMSGGIATEALRQAAKLILEKYGEKP